MYRRILTTHSTINTASLTGKSCWPKSTYVYEMCILAYSISEEPTRWWAAECSHHWLMWRTACWVSIYTRKCFSLCEMHISQLLLAHISLRKMPILIIHRIYVIHPYCVHRSTSYYWKFCRLHNAEEYLPSSDTKRIYALSARGWG